MGEDDEQLEAADPAAEAAENDDGDDGPSIEDRAREEGWRPRSEWKGDPKSWTPADEYLRMGDPKYLRKALREQKEEVRKLAQARAEDAKSVQDRFDRFEALNKAQRAKLYSDIEAARRQAVIAGDTEEYDRQNRNEQRLYEEEEAAGKVSAKPKEQAETPSELSEVTLKWVEDNEWFETDQQLHFAAIAINKRIANRNPSMSHEEQLEATTAEVRKKFPEKFGERKPAPKTNGHSAVEGGQRMAAQPKGKGFTDIPAEERKIIERHVEEGLYKDKAEAAKAYWR
jgi:hypothetical protein